MALSHIRDSDNLNETYFSAEFNQIQIYKITYQLMKIGTNQNFGLI